VLEGCSHRWQPPWVMLVLLVVSCSCASGATPQTLVGLCGVPCNMPCLAIELGWAGLCIPLLKTALCRPADALQPMCLRLVHCFQYHALQEAGAMPAIELACNILMMAHAVCPSCCCMQPHAA
jgi:hypothetical protein